MNLPAFIFNAAQHEYLVDNQVQPHVTGMMEKHGLTSYAGAHPWNLARKQILGRLVHDITRFHDEDGLSYPMAIGMVLDEQEENCRQFQLTPEIVSPYCSAWDNFLFESDFKIFPDYIERPLVAEVCGMRYGMTIDRAGLLRNKATIIDLKCTAGIEISWPVQLAGYALGLPRPVLNPPIWRWERAVVWLQDNGRYQLLPGGRRYTNFSLDKEAEEIFLCVLRLAYFQLDNARK